MTSARTPLASDVPFTSSGRMFWTMDRVAQALAAQADVPLPAGAREFAQVGTDTRAITPGTLFVALAGERFDAHDFLADAVRDGATALVVSDAARAAGVGVPVYVVRDTRTALGALARFRREAWGKPVIAVGGSNGKTSTKAMLAAMLAGAYDVHATRGNLNNEIGVPFTLLALPDDAEVAVVEAGTNSPGEIARLRNVIMPDVTVITSIGEEHLEGFGDIAGVLREELALTVDVPVVVTPAAHPEVAAGVTGDGQQVVVAGLDAGHMQPLRWRLEPDGSGTLTFEDGELHIPLRGVHNLRNAMLAVTVARGFGVTLEQMQFGLSRMTQPDMRAAVDVVGSAILVNDAYNANPPSMRAALDLLEAVGQGRPLVAVLGTMRELGSGSDALHDDIARDAVRRPLTLIVGVGDFAAALARVAPDDARVVGAADAPLAADAMLARTPANAAILLKGSRGARLERLVAPITAWATTAS
ncbi:MAG TPA: UDP-N-acetylmuramoyl-tripeptide--D-alanyl-D-alanine ligase [Gemmatimonadaceae bacterium]|nr:UDP-N-acetylmuramoyl-tripeptide--D-alanyl-D-alanine ligase [Gemmatimonadaceae bacterium]